MFGGLRLLVGGMLLYSGALHMAQPMRFAMSVAAYRLVPESLVGLVVFLLPALQIVIGLGIIIDPKRIGFAIAGAILFTLFVFAQVFALVLGRDISCGCFGFHGEPIGIATLLPAVIGLVGTGGAIWRRVRQSPVPQSSREETSFYQQEESV